VKVLSLGVSGVLAVFVLAGCERGCARGWLGEHGVGHESPVRKGGSLLNAIDCPDGMARCSEGVVQVSRLATIAQPCSGPPERCACPWDKIAECDQGCAGEGVEVALERSVAAVQLCTPGADSGVVATLRMGVSPHGCDEGQAYRCATGVVVACANNAVVAACVHGCVAEGASVEDDVPVTREGAFAILCAR
jgi:hypothetical protein